MKNASIKKIIELGQKNKKIVFISVDQPTGFDAELKKSLGWRFIVEPISESNVISMAAGLASEGFIPFVFNHATFNSRRCYEQILLDASLQKCNIKLLSMGAGLSTSHLGPTHTSIDDIGLMRLIPEMNIVVPCNATETSAIIPQIVNIQKSFYIRLTKFGEPRYGTSPSKKLLQKSKIGKPQLVCSNLLKSKKDVLFISNGALTPICVEVSNNLISKNISSSVLNVTTVKPLNHKYIYKHIKKSNFTFICEEHSIIGGLGSACLEVLNHYYYSESFKNIHRFALNDRFIHEYGDQEGVLNKYNLMPKKIEKKVLKILNI